MKSFTTTAVTFAVLLYIVGQTLGYRINSEIKNGRRFSTKGSEEVGPIDNYTCVSDGAFPHDDNCDYFIECWSGNAVLHRCTEVMLFDLRYNGCNFAEYVDCEDRIRPPGFPGTTTPKATTTTVDPTATTIPPSPTTPGPNDTFVCEQNGVFPHPRCEYYWSCYEGDAVLVHCELDYLFDLKYNGCNFPDQTDCGDRIRPPTASTTAPITPTQGTQPPTTAPSSGTSGVTGGSSTDSGVTGNPSSSTTGQPGEDFDCPAADGLFPNPEECTSYFSCTAGLPTKVTCPDGLHFSPEKQICDWPAEAGCEA